MCGGGSRSLSLPRDWGLRQARARNRQFHEEGGACVRSRFEADAPPMLVDDGVRDGEAESGAFANFLGREERVENFRLHILRDARSIVVDLENDAVAFRIVPGAYDDNAT